MNGFLKNPYITMNIEDDEDDYTSSCGGYLSTKRCIDPSPK